MVNHQRKLVPTFYEKLTWANGDSRGLRVVGSDRTGRVGALICGENTNPLGQSFCVHTCMEHSNSTKANMIETQPASASWHKESSYTSQPGQPYGLQGG